MESIRIACKGADSLDYTKLSNFQGNLKTLTPDNFEKLRREILNGNH